MGGLGNQMFQYATAKRLSVINNTELRIDASNFEKLTANSEHTLQLTNFNLSAKQASKAEVWKVVQPINLVARAVGSLLGRSPVKAKSNAVFREPDRLDFKPDILGIGPNRYLVGYFISYKYFDPIRSVLLDEYTPKDAISLQGQEMLRRIETTSSVSLHIRRGDYVNDPTVSKSIEGIITDRFYRNAVGCIAAKVNFPHFYVFSNDMAWVRENFNIPYPVTYVDINSAQRGFEDLWLMSRCKHNITAGGSTFSWWAAYLNPNVNKIVVTTEKISNVPKYNYPQDYFPVGWTSVSS